MNPEETVSAEGSIDLKWPVAERSLQESERRLATLLSNLPGMAYRCRNDRDWTMEFVSDGCEALTGYKSTDLVGNSARSFASLLHPNDRDRIWQEVQNAVSRQIPYRLTYRIIAVDGREKWVWEQGVGLFGANGLEALEGFITDVTDRKNADARLQSQADRFRAIIENTDAGYFRIGMDGCYKEVNPAWLRMHGFRHKEEIVGQHFSIVQPPADMAKAGDFAEALMRGESVKSGEFSRLRRDGTIGYHSFSANPVLDGDQVVGIEGFLIDISDRKAIERDKLDGKYVGPAGNFGVGRKYTVAAGDHEVRLSEPRYEDVVTKVTIAPGKTTKLAETMKALPPAKPPFGRLRTMAPDKFEAVYVNGKFMGHAGEFNNPVQGLMLNPGTYIVKVVPVNGGEGREEQIKIEADKVTIFQTQK